MIRDVAWRGESPYLVPAAKVEAIGDGGRFGSLLAETVREVAE
jgi:hypothetical protein